eukprot:CAMPEP_0174748984 /NCGR_PEP_ID=MMETSP1094-20130205/94718_1 /TAXON_ID=156173 /ORGANISM="Chrysochromulina brevifilum, Strain UTEX LB 985" /LENGTH=85 /DNA_ID=CAMNT_0015954119 /DNA_START=49 /DNA_END=306 /DNA_ORIENTATION=-
MSLPVGARRAAAGSTSSPATKSNKPVVAKGRTSNGAVNISPSKNQEEKQKMAAVIDESQRDIIERIERENIIRKAGKVRGLIPPL